MTILPLDMPTSTPTPSSPSSRGTARSGYGPVLFDSWRYLDPGDLTTDHSTRRLDPDFVLNGAALQGASVLLAPTTLAAAPAVNTRYGRCATTASRPW